jgi:uncharacterized protein (DUF1501 family)
MEPGQTMKRRDFIGTLPALVAASQAAFADPVRAGLWEGWMSGGSLVLVELLGGCDGLNLVVPYRDDWYFRRRPRIALPPGHVLPLNGSLGFPSAMAGLHDLYGRGFVAVMQGVGLESPAGSHFAARRYWGQLLQESGLVDAETANCSGREEFESRAETVGRSVGTRRNQCFRLGLRGFDTHTHQGREAGPHSSLLNVISETITGLARHLRRERRFQDVLILVTTEFGRSLDENAWAGTDHGNVAPWLLVGGRVKAGVYGSVPDLDPRAESAVPADPREVLAGLLGAGSSPWSSAGAWSRGGFSR